MLRITDSNQEKKSFSQWGTLEVLRSQVLNVSTDLIRKFRKNHWIDGIHYRQISQTAFLFNLPLISDWAVNGDGLQHQKAIEQYQSSLPSNQKARSGRRG